MITDRERAEGYVLRPKGSFDQEVEILIQLFAEIRGTPTRTPQAEVGGPLAHTHVTNLDGGSSDFDNGKVINDTAVRKPLPPSEERLSDERLAHPELTPPLPVPDETGLNPVPDLPERDVLKIGQR